MVKPKWKTVTLNPSSAKPFGTHTFYRGGGGVGRTPWYLKNRCSVTIVTPQRRGVLSGKSPDFSRKNPNIQIATTFTILKITL